VSADVYTTAPPPPRESDGGGGDDHERATLGDGTTARSRARRRWRSARWPLLVLTALVLVVLVLAASRPPASSIPFAPDNPGPRGARAVAEVLADQGVEVVHVTRVADALRSAGPGTTLLVTPAPFLLPEQADALAGTEADIVLAGADSPLVEAATGGAVTRAPQQEAPAAPVPSACGVPAATAAGPSQLVPGLVATGTGDVELCWRPEVDAPAALAQVRDAASGGQAVTAVDDPAFLTNEAVLDEGNAALALHLLGARERIVWLVQDPLDTTSGVEEAAPGDALLPPWMGAAGLWALLVALAAALWRGRRLGRLVPEPLPVVVRAAETTRGRGRLYRRARSRGHAAAGLRAATADRIARRLGLPRSADATAVTDAVVRATGRPTAEVADLLYGPPPADDAALTALARRLDTLESEVYRS
jgi:hypothetical protein